MNEPTTDAELQAAIEAAGYDFIDTGEAFLIRYRAGGGVTRLEARELSDALYEAYVLTKD